MSDGGIIIGLIFLGIVLLIAMAVAFSNLWGSERELRIKRENVKAETTNVRFCANKYRRELERAKEILGLGFMVMDRGRVELKEEEVKNISLPANMLGYQHYNIYSLLEGVLKTVTKAEEDLLYGVERANTRLADYNAYIKAPVYPRLVASAIGFSEERYDGGRLDEINRKLDESLAETKLLDGKLDKLLSETGIKSLGRNR